MLPRFLFFLFFTASFNSGYHLPFSFQFPFAIPHYPSNLTPPVSASSKTPNTSRHFDLHRRQSRPLPPLPPCPRDQFCKTTFAHYMATLEGSRYSVSLRVPGCNYARCYTMDYTAPRALPVVTIWTRVRAVCKKLAMEERQMVAGEVVYSVERVTDGKGAVVAQFVCNWMDNILPAITRV